ncbi:ATP-binding sensor histidine kinase [Nostoc sp. FACHB-888]|uniref:trifunctional serine/threonine-protein kinase/ATP-binding protein/sensor histidine kinase n=1 Tax=Nostoc sp. FACHB-888 TaxID=2692842 RepID=UPI00168723FF|nr:ATP-binding sensor histidine kinase [Nostoc sp. FACHB-888]MBD2248118.1 AAA family ATPase [Nostoc sp. FACHB-888]
MISLSGYQIINQIYESNNSKVYRAIQESDNKPVILKVLKEDYPTSQELARYKQEYELTRNLNFEGAIKVYGLDSYQRTLVLIIEDFAGISLDRWFQEKPLAFEIFFPVAIEIVKSLGNIHAAHLIHKDINPANIVFNPTTKQLKIIDFGIATVLKQEDPCLKNPYIIEGTLAYISPEQTRRMNRPLDYRTDFYSLGVTFYQLLTGQLPFERTDVLELIHCHLAIQPVPPHILSPKIPLVVSNLVMKLMGKTAEERYQSTYGIKADLEECLRQLESTGKIVDFPLATQDITGQIQIPQILYGRDAEISTLIAAFERVTAPEKAKPFVTELMLVTGYSGVGKTRLVQELYKPLTEKRGYFILGTFDQFQRNVPYSAVVNAFTNLVRQLLGESKAQLNLWREKLLTALGANGQIIIDVIPEVELIIGKQLPISELRATEAQNRFNLVFKNFIRVFCSSKQPLIIFLDNLQWADSASLKLIELIMMDAKIQFLFLIGAYRDNEINHTHPLNITLENLRKKATIINKIILKPLKLHHINKFISDAIFTEIKYIKPLAKLVYDKTNGNPFFVNEFLKAIYSSNLLVYKHNSVNKNQKTFWHWNIKLIKELRITDNVVELMLAQMQKMPKATQKCLSVASCMGAEFNLYTISIVCKKSEKEIFNSLTSAIDKGLIIPLSELNEQLIIQNYKFGHDRIQQAANILIDEEQNPAINLKIGRLLWKNTQAEELSGRLFEIADHLNLGHQLITCQQEQIEVAALNLLAGQKAKPATAYEAALNYLKVGQELLADKNWQKYYNLKLNIYVEATEVAYLNGNFEQMEQFTSVVLKEAKTLLDKVKVYEVNIEALQSQNKELEAIQIALSVLQTLGISFPELIQPLDIQQELEKTRTNLAGKCIENLINLPQMSEPYKLAIMRVTSCIFSSIYIAASNLLPLLVSKQVNLSLEYGNNSLSAFAYVNYGLILCGVSGEIEEGYQFGRLALDLVDKFHAKELISKVNAVFYAAISIWKEPIKSSLQSLQSAYQTGLEVGDLYYGTTCAYLYSFHSIFVGQELNNLALEVNSYSQLLSQLKQEGTLNYNNIYGQTVQNLIGRAESPYRLLGETYNEEIMLPLHIKKNDRYALCALYVNKLYLCYLFGEYSLALENAEKAEQYLDGATATLLIPLFYFYDSLAHLATYDSASKTQKQQILLKVTEHQEKMQNWASYASINYLHKFYLVEAEKHRVKGADIKAMQFYNRAIELAKENQYCNEQALSNELAAKFYLANDLNKIAKIYMTDAWYCYLKWGAAAKMKDLEEKYSNLLAIKSEIIERGKSTFKTTNEQTSSEVLDLKTVVKASQVIASEIVLNKLLEKLIKIVIENAGAQKGYLILDKGGEWVIGSQGSVNSDSVTIMQSIPVNSLDSDRQTPPLSAAIINYVARTQKDIVLNDAVHEGEFIRDPYVVVNQLKSVLCTPLLYQSKLSGILYLENNLTTGAFTPERVEILRILSTQAAISIENSCLYEQLEDYNRTLEQKVKARTQELGDKNQELASTLQKLKATQDQIIAQEKLASLGALAAGIAHEIKNPLNFVNNFAELSVQLTQELLEELETQKNQLEPQSRENTQEILDDLSKNSQKINEHGRRANDIVNGMLMLSRGQLGKRQLNDINALLEESINLAYHGMRAKDPSFQVAIETNYDQQIPKLNIIPQDISRAFINIINNACYAANEKKKKVKEGFLPKISIKTKDLGEKVEIRIQDNGNGISQEVVDKIFNPFFTTKLTGEGTGLGLSISHDIIVQGHEGEIRVETQVKNYTSFIMILPKNLPNQNNT